MTFASFGGAFAIKLAIMLETRLGKPPKAKLRKLDHSMETYVALLSIIRACAAHVIACTSYARRNTDAESLHQVRTAIRRLRAALSISRSVLAEPPPALVNRLRTLQLKLGVAREWDVLIEDTIGTMPKRIIGQKAFADIARQANARRAKEDSRARSALRERLRTDLLEQLTA